MLKGLKEKIKIERRRGQSHEAGFERA